MVGLLFQVFFIAITKIFSILLSPLFALINVCFPATDIIGDYILGYINYGITYISFAREVMLIPVGALSMLFSYFLTKYSIYLINISVKFIVNVYDTLKP